jgi:uncharacterized protein with von Willebrand factor type A (vWA) domain
MLSEKTDISRRSGAGLIENIVRFSHLLRDNGISVSLPAVLDAIQGLPLIDVSRLNEFLCLLRINFVSCKEDRLKFDSLFYSYWLPRERANLKMKIPSEGPGESQHEQDSIRTLREKITDLNTTANAAAKVPQKWALRYSPYSLPATDEKRELRFESSRDLYESITRLLQPMANRISRRFQYTIHGKEISLRKILRKNMKFGGELILLDFKKKRLKKRRVIFFCDISGSMDIYTLMILQFIHVLKRLDRSTEIFFFSTQLSRATRQFDGSDFTSSLSQIPGVISDWGGGTRIGHCLKRFNETFGKKQLSGKDIVMIFSDGWDRGEIDVLEKQLSFLKRKAYKIIWLNPLVGTRDYQPICQGMRAALPYVDYFLPMGNLKDLHSIGKLLKKIIL